jgi:hypothetical protein
LRLTGAPIVLYIHGYTQVPVLETEDAPVRDHSERWSAAGHHGSATPWEHQF